MKNRGMLAIVKIILILSVKFFNLIIEHSCTMSYFSIGYCHIFQFWANRQSTLVNLITQGVATVS